MKIRSPLCNMKSVEYRHISVSETFRLAPAVTPTSSMSNVDVFFKTQNGAYNLRTGLSHFVGDNVAVIKVKGYFQEEVEGVN